jgi:hypothetical protein
VKELCVVMLVPGSNPNFDCIFECMRIEPRIECVLCFIQAIRVFSRIEVAKVTYPATMLLANAPFAGVVAPYASSKLTWRQLYQFVTCGSLASPNQLTVSWL